MAQFITHIQPTLVEASQHHAPQHYRHKDDHREMHKLKEHTDGKLKDHQKGWSAYKSPFAYQEDVEKHFKVQ